MRAKVTLQAIADRDHIHIEAWAPHGEAGWTRVLTISRTIAEKFSINAVLEIEEESAEPEKAKVEIPDSPLVRAFGVGLGAVLGYAIDERVLKELFKKKPEEKP